jgi:hypothetical protein
MRVSSVSLVSLLSLSLAACAGSSGDQSMSSDEALASVNESSSSAEAATLASASIDLTSRLDLGDASIALALQSISDFVTTELPCAATSRAGDTLAIDYGANAGSCVFDGLAFSGVQTITLASLTTSSVEMDHTWSNVSDGNVQIGGSAHVTWSSANVRHVQSKLTWMRATDGLTGQGASDVTQTKLAGDFANGVIETGSRSWSNASGSWSLSISDAEQRWADPLPQAGSYLLFTANGKDASITFDRVPNPAAATNVIAATIKSGSTSYVFDVSAGGDATPL